MSSLRVFAFSPDWGLPTTGPFALKLLAWLELAGLPYQLQVENNPAKGPLGKIPWVEIDGEPMGDSAVIIGTLAGRHGIDIDAGLSPALRAESLIWARAFEEGFHQVLEWELFVHPAGAAHIDEMIATMVPPLLRDIVSRRLRRHFRKQLEARGIGRHPAETVAAIGRADIDAVALRLADRAFLAGNQPSLADLAIFGQLAPMICWPMATPVATHAKAQRPVVDFVNRLRERCFGAGRAAA